MKPSAEMLEEGEGGCKEALAVLDVSLDTKKKNKGKFRATPLPSPLHASRARARSAAFTARFLEEIKKECPERQEKEYSTKIACRYYFVVSRKQSSCTAQTI